MFLIADLLERAKAGAGIETDYRLGKVIGITHSVISGYRSGKSLPNESIIEQLCALSGDDPGVIAAQIQAARSKTPAAVKMWTMIAARLSGVASTAFLSVVVTIALIAGYAQDTRASGLNDSQKVKANGLYIVSTTFLSVVEFLRVRLRQITGFLWLCRLAAW